MIFLIRIGMFFDLTLLFAQMTDVTVKHLCQFIQSIKIFSMSWFINVTQTIHNQVCLRLSYRSSRNITKTYGILMGISAISFSHIGWNTLGGSSQLIS